MLTKSRWMLVALAIVMPCSALGQSAAIKRGLTFGSNVKPHSATPSQNRAVFIGGTRGFTKMLDPALAKTLMNAGVGLYQHGVAMNPLTSTQRTALLALWAPSGVNPAGGGLGIGEVTVGGLFGTATTCVATNSDCENMVSNFGTNGLYPVEVNAAVPTNNGTAAPTGTYTAQVPDAHPGHVYGNYVSRTDLVNSKAETDILRANGAKAVGFFLSPNGEDEDFDDPFAAGGFWANNRALYQYAGGAAFDAPPTYFWAREPFYRTHMVQEIQWLNAHRLRSNVVVSPIGRDHNGNLNGDYYDPVFIESTKRMYSYLRDNNALPTVWAVENYAAPSNAAATANIADGSAEGLDTVALWLAGATHPARHGPLPRPARHVRRRG